jgi:RHS repeat-associated protein
VTENGVLVESYSYDANGNRLLATLRGATANAAYDADDRLTQYGPSTYVFSSAGALQSVASPSGTSSFQYDALGDLVHVGLAGGGQVDYLVDSQHRRIGKRLNGGLAQGFVYADDNRAIAELDGANNVVSRFVYVGDGNAPAYMLKGGATYRIVADANGSPRLVIDAASAQVVERLDYDGFGHIVSDTNPGFQPFGFGGGLYDRDTTLVHIGARDYDPTTGRWTTPDPLRFDAGQSNLYVYVGDDPIDGRDASGLGGLADNGLDALPDVPKSPWAKAFGDLKSWWHGLSDAKDAADTVGQVITTESDNSLSDPEKAAGHLSCLMRVVKKILPIDLIGLDAANKVLQTGVDQAEQVRSTGFGNVGEANQYKQSRWDETH